MTGYHLDTAKLLRAVDQARRVGTSDPMPYRQVAEEAGCGPMVFTRLRKGLCPDVDALGSIIMWLDPDAKLSDYLKPGARNERRLRWARNAVAPVGVS